MHLKNKMITIRESTYQWWTLLWAMVIAYLSLTSAARMQQFNVWDFVGWDKAGHLFFYTVLTFMGLMGYARTSGLKMKMVIFFANSFGILMEFFQLYTSKGRLFEFNDVLANAAGVVVGYILFKIIIN